MNIKTMFDVNDIVYRLVYNKKTKDYTIKCTRIFGLVCQKGFCYFENTPKEGQKEYPIIIRYFFDEDQTDGVYETEWEIYKTRKEAEKRMKYLKEYHKQMDLYRNGNK